MKPNFKKEGFLKGLEDGVGYVVQVHEKFTEHISFSFQFFDISQTKVATDFRALSQKQLYELFDKLKEYSRNTFKYWADQKNTQNSYTFVEYGDFPAHSKFKRPKHVPVDVRWGRFRVNSTFRLCGFTVPSIVVGPKTFSAETFYVVFIDLDHNFYPTEKK